MVCPLLLPFRELGWYQGFAFSCRKTYYSCSVARADDLLKMEETVFGRNADYPKVLFVREYYAYKLQIRHNVKPFLLCFGRLLQQTQQEEIRQEFFQRVVDAMAKGETEGFAIGRQIVLPLNFICGRRSITKKYVDVMALVQKFGKPNIIF
uniref:Helitron helicase-like domain-containing protein n=1 Tax=Lactuca sativa TaxID=4236 RepID=A0A9R1VNE2_LACSA|nr:hypothetical protein LSAT_V11C500264800 [Lactuca sativa]